MIQPKDLFYRKKSKLLRPNKKMKLFQNLFLLSAVIAPTVVAVPFDDDSQQFYVEGQVINDALEDMNFLLCMVSAVRADAFVGDGPYQATLYDEDCDSAGNSSAEQSAATPTSSSSSSTASSASGNKAAAKVSTSTVADVVRVGDSVQTSAWFDITGEDDGQEASVFMGVTQTGGVSESSPNGDFVINYSINSGDYVGAEGGYAEASGATVKYRDWLGESNIVKKSLPNGDSEGVFSFSQSANEGTEVFVTYQFYISVLDKAYCQRLSTAAVIEPDAISEGKVDVTDSLYDWPELGLSLEEKCYSTDVTKAQRNVYRYGVYINGGSDDGQRLEMDQGGFPLYADVLNNGETQRVHAYADYWGVWVEPEGRALIDANTPFKRDSFDEADGVSDVIYNLSATDIRIEKRDTSYSALNDLDGLSIALYVDDEFWSAQFTSLFGEKPEYPEYEGKFDKDGAADGSGQFVFTKGISFDNGYAATTLLTPIIFSVAEWQQKMVIEYGSVSDDWYFKDVRQMGVWSNDTRQWYDISAAAMSDPTSATSDAGIRTEVTSIISASDITEPLYCFRDCVDGTLVQQTFTQAVAEGASLVSTPFADVGSYLKEDVTVDVVSNDYASLSAATSGFYLANNSLGRGGFKLGEGGGVITDFVNGDVFAKRFSSLSLSSIDSTLGENDEDVPIARYNLEGPGLSSSNLNKLLSFNPADPGVMPIFNLDLVSIPEVGTSGSATVDISVSDMVSSRKLAANVVLDYVATPTGFVMTIPKGATVALAYTGDNGVPIQIDYVSSKEWTFASASETSGLSLNLFQLLDGTSGLYAVQNVGIGDFFGSNSHELSVTLSNTELAMLPSGDDDRSVQQISISFGVTDDESLVFSQTYQKGEYFEGLLASDLYKYTLASGVVLDPSSVALTKGAAAAEKFATLDDPNSLLQDVSYSTADGWQQSLAWGVRTGQLVPESSLAQMECLKVGETKQYEFHPVYGTTTDTLRYCESAIYEGNVSSTYTISLEATPTYALNLESTGEPVVISQPKVLYYTVPETQDNSGEFDFGEDAGKRLRLEFAGHGDLRGIPGFVFNTATGEDLGEFVTDWNESYRYLNRFIIPDGGLVTDAVDDSVSYKVKALDGEEWLVDADGSVNGVADVRGKYSDFYSLTEDDLVSDDIRLVEMGNPNNVCYIGDKPTALINSGRASVIHGEVMIAGGQAGDPASVVGQGLCEQAGIDGYLSVPAAGGGDDGEVGNVEVGVGEEGVGEEGDVEVGDVEVGDVEVGDVKVGVGEVGDIEVGVGEQFIVGTWKLAPIAGALSVGFVPGSGDLWANSEAEATGARACLFDDTYTFAADGSFSQDMGDSTWMEPWQGTDPEACGTPAAPHDGSAKDATYTYENNVLTINGLGAHIGLPKAVNDGELSSAVAPEVPASIKYALISVDGLYMTAIIDVGGLFWTFTFVKVVD